MDDTEEIIDPETNGYITIFKFGSSLVKCHSRKATGQLYKFSGFNVNQS